MYKGVFTICVVFFIALIGLKLFFPPKGFADLVLVSDTLSSSRLSVAARVLTLSGNLFTIDPTATGNFVSTSTANLREGDPVLINAVAEVVKAIIPTANQFTTVNGAPAGVATNPIYFVSQPVHQVTFRTTTSVPAGFFRILIPAGVASGSNNDGLPDRDGFDFNTMTSTYATASATANFAFVTTYTSATVSGGAQCTTGYHCFEFHYTGTGPANSDITLWLGTGVKSLVAPAPATGHSLGIADAYTIIVQQFANGIKPDTGLPIDATNAKLALIEAVHVTATVDPSISFQITGIANGASACGVSTTINTQTAVNAPLTVPFGTLALNTFATAAHQLTVSTNAANGYIVTAIANDEMGKDGGTTPFIPKTSCNSGSCSVTTPGNWDVATAHPGFGYSLQSVSGANIDFAPGANFNAKPFAKAAAAQPPTRIMYANTIANAQSANVCYRVAVDATQAAGDYENQVTYTATASF